MYFITAVENPERAILSVAKIMMFPEVSYMIWHELQMLQQNLIFSPLLSGPFAVIDQHLDITLPNCHDAVCLMLIICITRKHQVRRYKHNVLIV
jgi:vacuolar protein sorting-associated protein 52